MKLNELDLTFIYMLLEMGSLAVLFILDRVVQFFLNKKKAPYIARNVNDPRIVSVYIYRMQKYGSRYLEYKFLNVAGSWRPVMSKRSIIGFTVASLIMCGIIVYLAGIKGFICMGLPVALFVAALTVVRYYEAYRILIRN